MPFFSNRHARRHSFRVMAGLVCVVAAACGRKPKAADASAPPPPTDVSADNVAVVDSELVESGPSLSGTLTPERAAQLRAQAAGAILSLYVEEGAAVTAGQPVALIDTLALAEAARSARSQLVSAQLSADVARRNYERYTTLHNAGAVADRDFEVAHNQSVAADAMMADAKSKLTTAEKQLANAMVQAPFTGVVSVRPASVGDVLQVGNPIMTIVDPTELQLEGSVAAEFIGQIKPGSKVDFSVNGNAGHVFSGRVARINPTVDSVTRQVRLYIAVPNHDRTLAGGLFAQGRVAMMSVRGLAIPVGALDSKSASPSVRRLKGGMVEAVPVTVGVRDDLEDRVQITGGLALGDTVLMGAALTTPAGVAVRVAHADH